MNQTSKKHLFYACLLACEDDKGRHTKDISSLHGCGVVFHGYISNCEVYTLEMLDHIFCGCAVMNWVMPVPFHENTVQGS